MPRPKRNLLDTIQDRYSSFSRRQQTLARFITQNYQQAAFLGISALAQSSGVSEATIVRFAKTLGFSGYPSLQKEIRRIVRLDLVGSERFKAAVSANGGQSVLDRIISKELENLSELKERLRDQDLQAVVKAIRAASEVVIVGARSTASLAHHLSFALKKLEIRTRCVAFITSETYDELYRTDKSALIIVIGFPRYLTELIDVLDFSRSIGRQTLSITDSPLSPLSGDLNLHCPAESISFIAFHCAPLVLINLIITEIGLADETGTMEALDRFEQLANQQQLFDRTSAKRPAILGIASDGGQK